MIDIVQTEFSTFCYKIIKGKRLYHCDGDKPAISINSKIFEYYYNGKRQRNNDKPAYITPDIQIWYYKGKKHRLNNPSVIHADGTVEYWLNDKHYTKETYFKIIKQYKNAI